MVVATFCTFDSHWSNEGKKHFIIQWTAGNFNAPGISFYIPQRFLDLAKDKNIIFTNLRLRYNGQVGAVISRITVAYYLSSPNVVETALVGTLLATTLDGQIISYDNLNIPFFWDDGWVNDNTMVATVQSNYLATDDMNIDLLGYIEQRTSVEPMPQPSIPEIPKVTVEGVKFWRR